VKIGDIINKDGQFWIVTEVNYGVVSDIERIETFVSRIHGIMYEDSYYTIEEIIDMKVNEFLSDKLIIQVP
jgi:hypothetical protein